LQEIRSAQEALLHAAAQKQPEQFQTVENQKPPIIVYQYKKNE